MRLLNHSERNFCLLIERYPFHVVFLDRTSGKLDEVNAMLPSGYGKDGPWRAFFLWRDGPR